MNNKVIENRNKGYKEENDAGDYIKELAKIWSKHSKVEKDYRDEWDYIIELPNNHKIPIEVKNVKMKVNHHRRDKKTGKRKKYKEFTTLKIINKNHIELKKNNGWYLIIIHNHKRYIVFMSAETFELLFLDDENLDFYLYSGVYIKKLLPFMSSIEEIKEMM